MAEIKYNTVVYNGKPMYNLNGRLIESQGVTDEQLKRLLVLHELKLFLFELMEKTDDPVQLKAGADLFEQIEFALQRNWNFTEDAGFHEWYTVPKCRCPKLDNAERRFPGASVDLRIYSGDCPIHKWDC